MWHINFPFRERMLKLKKKNKPRIQRQCKQRRFNKTKTENGYKISNKLYISTLMYARKNKILEEKLFVYLLVGIWLVKNFLEKKLNPEFWKQKFYKANPMLDDAWFLKQAVRMCLKVGYCFRLLFFQYWIRRQRSCREIFG